MPECSVIAKSWSELTIEEFYSIAKLRTDVFYLEQRADDEELDGRDLEPETVHYWIAAETGEVAAYIRVLFNETAEHLDAHRVIGRVVVHAAHRGKGLAQVIMARILEDFGDVAMMLHAQTYIVPLYVKSGFVGFGDVYDEAGIDHLSMYRAANGARAASV